jgi:hypothetical protein
MLQRVERNPPQSMSGIVAKPPSCECVRSFMERDGDEDRKNPGGGLVE